MSIDMKLGNAVREARKAKNISSSDLANRLKITIPTLLAYERGVNPIPPERLTTIKKILPNLDDGTADAPTLNAREPEMTLTGGVTVKIDAIVRSMAGVSKLGPAATRKLVEVLGGLKTSDEHLEFAKKNEGERSAWALHLLLAFDKARGKKVDFDMVQALLILQQDDERCRYFLHVLSTARKNDLTIEELQRLIEGTRKA